jgi:hypothetical protein
MRLESCAKRIRSDRRLDMGRTQVRGRHSAVPASVVASTWHGDAGTMKLGPFGPLSISCAGGELNSAAPQSLVTGLRLEREQRESLFTGPAWRNAFLKCLRAGSLRIPFNRRHRICTRHGVWRASHADHERLKAARNDGGRSGAGTYPTPCASSEPHDRGRWLRPRVTLKGAPHEVRTRPVIRNSNPCPNRLYLLYHCRNGARETSAR